jgi:outer membrane lipoprotein-sorting protein
MNRLFVATVLSLSALAWLAPAETLQSALARMDASAPQFHSMSADLDMVTYTAILSDSTTESGNVKMERSKNETRALISFTGNSPRTIAFLEKTVQIYYPNLKLVQVYKLGKSAKVLDQYLLLGFGTSGKDLVKGYNIKMAGTEKINGHDATKLELTPKEKSIREQLSKVDMWLPLDSGYPVQQKFYNPSGNYRLATYTNFELNPPLGAGSLKLNTPPDVKVEHPQ